MNKLNFQKMLEQITYRFPKHVCCFIYMHADLSVLTTVASIGPRDQKHQGHAHEKIDDIAQPLQAKNSQDSCHNVTRHHNHEQHSRRPGRSKDILTVIVLNEILVQVFQFTLQLFCIGLREFWPTHLTGRMEESHACLLDPFMFPVQELWSHVRLVSTTHLPWEITSFQSIKVIWVLKQYGQTAGIKKCDHTATVQCYTSCKDFNSFFLYFLGINLQI